MKSKYSIISVGLLIFFLCNSCSTTKEIRQQYTVANFTILFFDTTFNDFVHAPTFVPNSRHWYRDSFVIAQSIGISGMFETDIQNRGLDTMWYTFMNLRTREFYRYENFSDTATLIKAFIGPDSLSADGGWNFFAPRNGIYSVDSNKQKLSDTVLNNIRYKRIPIVALDTVSKPARKDPGIAFLDCTKRNPLMQFDATFGNKMGCPVVRVDFSPFIHGGNSGQITFIADSLTPHEQKVFDTWEKYAKQNPVLK